MPKDNFDGKVFHNRAPLEHGPLDMLRLGTGFALTAERWPEWIDIQQRTVPNERVNDGLSVTFINHATLLIQVGGLNILTDPVYAERVSPFSFAGPKRIHAPGIRFEDLPPIDVVLVSHNHYDHLDVETLKQLNTRGTTPPLVLTGIGNGALFKEIGLTNFAELNWEDTRRYGDTEFVFVECRHRSGRGIADQMKTLWGSFVIKTSEGNIYFAGDTAYGPHLGDTGENHGPFALTLIPIGAYEPRWFMKEVHLNPAEAVKAHQELRSEQSVGMHFGTFQLTYEKIEQPVIDLEVALEEAGIARDDFWTLEVGETRRVK